jgi:RNA polymerase sigma factor (sigma-70 family)
MASKYKKIRNIYLQEFNKEPSDAAYCHELKITLKDLARVRAYINTDVLSLDYKHTNADGGEYALVDMLEDPIDPMDEVLDREQERELKEAVDKVLARLPKESADILKMRFYEQKTLKECGEVLGKTRAAAQVCENRALRTIRRTPESINLLRTFIDPDEVYDLALTRKSVKHFLTDRTSPTEYAAIRLLSLEEQKRTQAQKMTAYYDHIGAKYLIDEHLAVEA